MILELIKTKNIILNFDKMVSDSPYKTEYISAQTEIPLPTFYRKLRENKFNIDEMIAILKVIQPEQYAYEMLTEKVKLAEEQMQKGEVIAMKDFEFSAKNIVARQK